MTSALLFFSNFIMAQATANTSPAEYTPRPPHAEERTQLADWLLSTGAYDAENARRTVEAAYIAVFDGYCTGGPGYAGKVMSVIWDGAPSTFDVFVWRCGRMERSGREYDDEKHDPWGFGMPLEKALEHRLAEMRSRAKMRLGFNGYRSLLAEEKIRLAMDILYDVCDHWEHDNLLHYPEDLLSFEEFLAELATKLYPIEWKRS